jgi:integrase/recombinase XerD
MSVLKVKQRRVKLDEALLLFLNSKKKSTKHAYSSCLRRFREYRGEPFTSFINEIEEQIEANKDLLLSQRIRPGESSVIGFIEWHKTKGYSPKATRQSIAALQNALKYYGITLSTDFIELPPNRVLKENEKHKWTLEEVKAFVDSADYLRDKAFIMVAFQSGLGVGDIVELDYSDIKREYEEGKQPLMIHTYRKKTGNEIKTFLGRDAIHYLRMYLQTKPNLKNGDPLFTKLGSTRRVSSQAIAKQLRQYAAKSKFIYEDDLNIGFNPARPHSLRSAFRSRLTGKMDNTLIEFFMGHSIGDQVKTYINMPDDELRELYANYEHLLAIEKTSKEEESEKRPKALPEQAVKQIKEAAQENARLRIRIAELEEKVSIISEQLGKLEKNIGLQLQGFEAAIRARAK